MRIAVNTRWLLHNKLEGIGQFTHQLLSRVVKNHPEVQFDFYFDRPFHPSFIYAANVTGYNLLPPARHPYLWYVWYEFSIKRKLKKTAPDLFFSPDGFIPTSGKTKTLNTIHDLNFEHHPDWIPDFAIGYYKKYFPLCAEKATRLLTVSEYSRTDICQTYKTPLSKIDVVYNGSGDFSKASHQDIENFKTKFTNGKPYFIFVGALNPRKNLKHIFLAFDKLSSNHKLLVVGNKMHWSKEIELAYGKMAKKDDVVFTERLDHNTLNTAYSGSVALVFPSLFEGFGIPILEAFKAETAVITANNTSMPEVAGHAALLVNAQNPDSILEAMQKLIADNNLRPSLTAKGNLQVQNFSWDASALKLWASMLKTMEG